MERIPLAFYLVEHGEFIMIVLVFLITYIASILHNILFIHTLNTNVMTQFVRALSKHYNRGDTGKQFWGEVKGSESEKNKCAYDKLACILDNADWINCFKLPNGGLGNGLVLEVRMSLGYGARWHILTDDCSDSNNYQSGHSDLVGSGSCGESKVAFRGLLEPFIGKSSCTDIEVNSGSIPVDNISRL